VLARHAAYSTATFLLSFTSCHGLKSRTSDSRSPAVFRSNSSSSARISASKGIFMLSCPAILYRSVAGHPDGGKFRAAGHPALPESDGSSEGHQVAGSRHVPVGDSFWLNVPWLHYQPLDALHRRFRSFDETQRERLRRKCTVCESGYVGVPTATRRWFISRRSGNFRPCATP
jgi:hypothetical protein